MRAGCTYNIMSSTTLDMPSTTGDPTRPNRSLTLRYNKKHDDIIAPYSASEWITGVWMCCEPTLPDSFLTDILTGRFTIRSSRDKLEYHILHVQRPIAVPSLAQELFRNRNNTTNIISLTYGCTQTEPDLERYADMAIDAASDDITEISATNLSFTSAKKLMQHNNTTLPQHYHQDMGADGQPHVDGSDTCPLCNIATPRELDTGSYHHCDRTGAAETQVVSVALKIEHNSDMSGGTNVWPEWNDSWYDED